MTLIDFHCHLTESGGYEALRRTASLFDPPARVITVTNRPPDWKAMVRGRVPEGVTWALGLHPAGRQEDPLVDDLLRLLPSAEAIGEVGLDYSAQTRTPRERQRRTLDRILAANEAGLLLVSIHSRNATADAVEAVNDHRVPGAILHWFLGNDHDVERAIDADAFFSINETMLHSERGRRVIDSLPPNRVVLETDAPYGGHRRKIPPADLSRTLAGLANRWNHSEDEARALVETNQQTLLNRVSTPAAMR